MKLIDLKIMMMGKLSYDEVKFIRWKYDPNKIILLVGGRCALVDLVYP